MELFENHDLSFLNNIGVCDVKVAFKDCKDILVNQDSREWNDTLWDDGDLINGNKLRTYRTFVSELSTSNYVVMNILLYKKVFSMLRCGSLPLEIEKGRHRPQPKPLNERKCKMCCADTVEDQFHFIMNCNLYEDQRQALFQHCLESKNDFNGMSEYDKFIHIMQTGNCKIIDIVFKMYMRRALFVA